MMNLDEYGFSIHGMNLERSKWVFRKDPGENEPKFRGTCDHVTIMPAVSVFGQMYTPIVVLPGTEVNWRNRSAGKFETQVNFLPQPNLLFMRAVTGIGTNIFLTWTTNFIEETFIVDSKKKILLVMDGYSAHFFFKMRTKLRDNNFIVFGLPTNTSHIIK